MFEQRRPCELVDIVPYVLVLCLEWLSSFYRFTHTLSCLLFYHRRCTLDALNHDPQYAFQCRLIYNLVCS